MSATAAHDGGATGERDALTAFCVREHPRLVGALSLYCGDARLAEELAQETLLRAIDAWPRLQQMAAPGAWAHRVGMNLANSWFRRRRAERRANGRALADGPAHHEDPDVAARDAVRRAVAALPERQRRAIVLRHYLGYDLDAAADLVGVTPQALSALTYRGATALRAALDDRDDRDDHLGATAHEEAPDAR